MTTRNIIPKKRTGFEAGKDRGRLTIIPVCHHSITQLTINRHFDKELMTDFYQQA